MRPLTVALAVVALVEAALIAAPPVRRWLFPPEESRLARGERLARESGCFACHGPGGEGHRPNPGAPDGEVPSFTGGTPMMYADTPAELREYVANGAPAKKRADPRWVAQQKQQLLTMPAFGTRLAPGDVDAIVAWVDAASEQHAPEGEAAAKGIELARTLNCFGCHGTAGAGGVGNPGALKGYIPGFLGRDFDELVRDDAELRSWIKTGTVSRLEQNAAARAFLHREAIRMPAFGPRLTDAQVDLLVAMIRALRTPLTPPSPSAGAAR